MPTTVETTQTPSGAPPRRSVARNSLFGMAGQLAIRGLSVLFGVAVVRRFGAETFGQYSAALAFVGLFSVLSDLGLGSWGVRAVAQQRERTRELMAQVASIRLILSTATAVVIVGIAAALYPPGQVLAITIASCSLLLFAVNGTLDMAWLGHERLDISSTVSLVNQIGFVAIGSAVLIFHAGALALILASQAALAVATFVSWRLARRHLGFTLALPDMRGWWPLVCACAPIGAVQISLLVSYKVDTVLLSIFRDSATVGMYAVAYNVIFSLMLLSHSVNLALFPALSRAADDRATLTRLAAQAIRYLALTSVPIAVGGAVLAPSVITTIYTDRYARSGTVLSIVIWVLPLMFFTEFLGYYATAIHRERAAGRAAVVMSVVNVVLNLICIPRFGALAAAVITVVTEVIFLAQYLWMLRDRGVIAALIRAGWRPVVAAIVMAAVLRSLPVVALPLAIGTGVMIYSATFLLLGGVTRADVAHLRRAPQPPARVPETLLPEVSFND